MESICYNINIFVIILSSCNFNTRNKHVIARIIEAFVTVITFCTYCILFASCGVYLALYGIVLFVYLCIYVVLNENSGFCAAALYDYHHTLLNSLYRSRNFFSIYLSEAR